MEPGLLSTSGPTDRTDGQRPALVVIDPQIRAFALVADEGARGQVKDLLPIDGRVETEVERLQCLGRVDLPAVQLVPLRDALAVLEDRPDAPAGGGITQRIAVDQHEIRRPARAEMAGVWLAEQLAAAAGGGPPRPPPPPARPAPQLPFPSPGGGAGPAA